MRLIPPKIRKQIADDPFMKKCIWTGETKDITWEHCWIYGGKQIIDAWATVPLVRRLNTNAMPQEVKEYCRWVTLMRATAKDLAKYPKKNWEQEKKYLTYKFTNYARK